MKLLLHKSPLHHKLNFNDHTVFPCFAANDMYVCMYICTFLHTSFKHLEAHQMYHTYVSVGLHWLSVHACVFISVQVNLEDLYNGKTSKLAVHRNVVCSTCNGIGGKEVRESVRGIQCMLTSRHHA